MFDYLRSFPKMEETERCANIPSSEMMPTAESDIRTVTSFSTRTKSWLSIRSSFFRVIRV